MARLLFVLYLFSQNANIRPEEVFRAQLNGGQSVIGKLVAECRSFDSISVTAMIREIKNQLMPFLKGRGLVIAVDEASLADKTMENQLISPSALVKVVIFC